MMSLIVIGLSSQTGIVDVEYATPSTITPLFSNGRSVFVLLKESVISSRRSFFFPESIILRKAGSLSSTTTGNALAKTPERNNQSSGFVKVLPMMPFFLYPTMYVRRRFWGIAYSAALMTRHSTM